jgi:hypothetical protein
MNKQIRKLIREHAIDRMNALNYRIAKNGQVDYYGLMPNRADIGWYFVAWDAGDWAKTIAVENQLVRTGRAIG